MSFFHISCFVQVLIIVSMNQGYLPLCLQNVKERQRYSTSLSIFLATDAHRFLNFEICRHNERNNCDKSTFGNFVYRVNKRARFLCADWSPRSYCNPRIVSERILRRRAMHYWRNSVKRQMTSAQTDININTPGKSIKCANKLYALNPCAPRNAQ